MGLDMYLSARKYVSEYFGGVPKENIEEAIRLLGFKQSDLGQDYASAELKLTAVYWRKVNAVHGWFVKNVQDDVDDCGSYNVSREQLQQLLADCEEVLAFKEKAGSILPPAAGFFFGTYEYDEWYWDGIQYTRNKLKKLLNNPAFKDCDFSYQSSW